MIVLTRTIGERWYCGPPISLRKSHSAGFVRKKLNKRLTLESDFVLLHVRVYVMGWISVEDTLKRIKDGQ